MNKIYIFTQKDTEREIVVEAESEKDAWAKLALETAKQKDIYYDAAEWELTGSQG